MASKRYSDEDALKILLETMHLRYAVRVSSILQKNILQEAFSLAEKVAYEKFGTDASPDYGNARNSA